MTLPSVVFLLFFYVYFSSKAIVKNCVLKHATSNVYRVDILVWSPTKKYISLFYDFLEFTMIFQRFSQNNIKEREKPQRKTSMGSCD